MNCSVADCKRQLLCKGLCRMHYERRRKGMSMLAPVKKDMSMDDQFLSRATLISEHGCIEWQGGRDRDGYGVFTAKGKTCRAHRYAFERTNGPIPAGMLICHRCDNPSCINVTHLFVGTALDNAADMISKGRDCPRAGAVHHYAKLTDELVSDIRLSDLPSAVIARRLGLTVSTVSSARKGKTWMHVETPPPSKERRAEIHHAGRCRGVTHPRSVARRNDELLAMQNQRLNGERA